MIKTPGKILKKRMIWVGVFFRKPPDGIMGEQETYQSFSLNGATFWSFGGFFSTVGWVKIMFF